MQLSDLKIDRDQAASRIHLLAVIDFYLIQCPRYGGSDRMNPQSLDLKRSGWSSDGLLSAARRTLFDYGDLHFVWNGKDFSSAARAKGFYSDERIAKRKSSAILQQNGEICFKRDGTATFSKSEDEFSCLCRHIRNSLAHGNIYRLRNGKILLLDKSDSRAFTAYVITTGKRLFNLMELIRGARNVK